MRPDADKIAEELKKLATSKKLQIIDNVATNLWGKDLRDAYQIAGAVCMPIFDYIDEVLESKETK